MVVINSFGLCLECSIRASQILNHHKGQVAQNLKRWCDERRAFAFLLFAIVLNTKILVVSEMLDAEDVASAVLLACTAQRRRFIRDVAADCIHQEANQPNARYAVSLDAVRCELQPLHSWRERTGLSSPGKNSGNQFHQP